MIYSVSANQNRVLRCHELRNKIAADDASVAAPPELDNGDEARYADKCGTYTKGILQAGIGRVDPAAYRTFHEALHNGHPSAFEKIVLGGTRTLNGPQGGLAFDLQCLDGSQFLVPPAPPLASEEYAAELVELYWASLLRDVAFADYASDALAARAAAELSSLAVYQGPRDASHRVSPELLFRGGFEGETVGPYVSQFLVKNACLGALPFTQLYTTFQPGLDYMLDAESFLQVQNGIPTGKALQTVQPRFLRDGRGLGAYTHNDVLYQAYFTAFVVLNALLGTNCAIGDMPAPLNPGNPYLSSKTQNGFTTLGGPDIASTLAAVASEALKAVWYQKWFVHLRHRPESGGAIVHLARNGQGNTVEGKLSPTVLNSRAVEESFGKCRTYFLPQAFPEGSPTHPAYPTGHGTVAGACITVLKFFYDGNFVIPNPQIPSSDGARLLDYTGSDAGSITVNGELNKLAHNVSFGHGIHSGIHWRSDTDTSIQLGEEVALSVLRDRAPTYHEKFTVHLSRVDGRRATISNH